MRRLSFLLIPFFALMTAGCASWDYSGETRDPVPSDEHAVFFPDPDKIPPDFVRIGSFRYTSSSGKTSSEVRRAVRDHALSQGANGILIREMRRIPTGEVRQDQLSNRQAPGWNKEDNSSTSHAYTVDTILYSSGETPERTVYKFEVEGDLFRGPSVFLEKP